jgi:GNAT superfamily N-acetyltransferase
MDLAEILADSFHSREGMGGWVYPLLRLGIYEDLRSRLNSSSSRYVCLAAVAIASKRPGVGDRLVGTVEISVRSRIPFAIGNSFQYAYLSNLAVDRNCRRQGVAQKLLLNSERIARSWGFEALYLHVLENNRSARRLYFKLGYRLHKVDGGLTCLLLGKPRRLLLVKHLSSSAITDET